MKANLCSTRIEGSRNCVSLLRTAFVFLCLGVLATGSTRALTLISQTTWGGTDSDTAAGVAVVSDGTAYVTGTTRSFSGGVPNIFLLKFAADGSLSWQRTWAGPGSFNDNATGVAVGSDGSVYVTGSTLGIGGDAVLLKFDSNGTLVWQRIWGGSANEQGQAVAVAADGSVCVVGSTASFGSGSTNVFVVKFAADGTLVWQKFWSTTSEGQGVAVGPDGSVYAAGNTPRPGTFNFDLVVLKLSSSGSLVSQRVYTAGDIVDARGGLTVAPDGSAVYVAGGIQAPQMGIEDLDALLLKLTPDESLVWDRSWGGRNGEAAQGVGVAPDGTVYLAGSTHSFGAGNEDAFVVQLLPSGKATDAITWGSAGLDNGSGVGVAGDGTVKLAGTASAPPYSFLRAPTKTTRLRGSLATPTGSLLDALGSASDAGGVVSTPNGSQTFAGGFDAAFVRIAP